MVDFNPDKPVELIEINQPFIDGQTGAFSEETTLEERKVIVNRINGFDISDEKKRFVDMFIFTGFDEAAAFQAVFNQEQELSDKQVQREAKKLMEKDKSVVNYLTFIREQSILALGVTDKAEFYMKSIVDELYSAIEGDVYDYVDYVGARFTVKDPEELTKRQRKRVKKLKITEMPMKSGEIKTTIEVELHDKHRQLDMLMKHLKMFTEHGFGQSQSDEVTGVIEEAIQDIEAEYTEYEEVEPNDEPK